LTSSQLQRLSHLLLLLQASIAAAADTSGWGFAGAAGKVSELQSLLLLQAPSQQPLQHSLVLNATLAAALLLLLLLLLVLLLLLLRTATACVAAPGLPTTWGPAIPPYPLLLCLLLALPESTLPAACLLLMPVPLPLPASAALRASAASALSESDLPAAA
jgi:hypothetical protein